MTTAARAENVTVQRVESNRAGPGDVFLITTNPVLRNNPPVVRGGGEPPPQLMVFSLNNLTTGNDKLDMDAVLNAVRTGVELQTSNDGSKADLRLDKRTNILIVRGIRRQVEAASHVVQELNRGRQTVPSASWIESFNQELQELKANLEEVKQDAIRARQ